MTAKQQDLFFNSMYESGAVFSKCKKYRYTLWRIWDKSMPLIMFIGLNPSTANEINSDPTITRVIGFAKLWGYGGIYMTNLFAYISSDPSELLKCQDPIADNDVWLKSVIEKCNNQVIFAWGDFKVAKDRSKEVCKMFTYARALIINKNGTPRHPLYVSANTIPVDFKIN